MPTIPPGLTTTDATLTEYPSPGPSLPPDSLTNVTLFVFASTHLGDVAIFTQTANVRRTGAGAPQGILGALDKKATAGAAAWTIQPFFSENSIKMRVQGAVGQTIDWLFVTDEAFIMAQPT